jgi:hypothetical protein
MRNEFVIADLQAAINKYQESNENDEKLQIQLEEEQKRNQKLTLDLKIKESELGNTINIVTITVIINTRNSIIV